MPNVERDVVKAPNETMKGDHRANGYLPLAGGASTVHPSNEARKGGDRRGGTADLAGQAPTTNRRTTDSTSAKPRCPTAVGVRARQGRRAGRSVCARRPGGQPGLSRTIPTWSSRASPRPTEPDRPNRTRARRRRAAVDLAPAELIRRRLRDARYAAEGGVWADAHERLEELYGGLIDVVGAARGRSTGTASRPSAASSGPASPTRRSCRRSKARPSREPRRSAGSINSSRSGPRSMTPRTGSNWRCRSAKSTRRGGPAASISGSVRRGNG